ncbi:ATP-binding cassette domain-containing protein [Bosea sp. (in: a-proteobacteria)]|uniref:branched-chain amino acid ABC transporter ATP-binding protein/permease n=1 Tax=Bosea sp. (in: a-proteobacteria) TaxID=1871050 RepID=UPI002632E9AB|nr:branched-chain amino acid ABC transporter ATP-binding protein/permease [Bosea sp. (in: a-proteobacteria)]MCO5091217.1 branched-chain amino acid ABC transporter ATP-binding protein/permease [Bosea sp. (in: a-proteobacteria)]
MKRDFTILVIALLVAGGVPVLTSDRYILTVATSVMIWAYLSSAWNILGGLAGQLSFGHAIFFGAGAYTSGALFAQWGWHPLIGGALGIVFACVLAVAIGYVSVRYGLVHLHFALVTTAISQVALFFAMGSDFVGGVNGLSLPFKAGPWQLFFRDTAIYYWIFLAMTGLVIAFTIFIRNRKLGLYFMCVRESEIAASGIGIDVMRQKLLAIVLSAALTAGGGVMFAQFLRFLDPDSIFGWAVSIEIVIPAMLGGTLATFGPALGALIYVILHEVTRASLEFAGAPLVIVGIVLTIVVLFLPEGIIPSWRMRWRRKGRKTAPQPQPAAAPAPLVMQAVPAPKSGDVILRAEAVSRRFGGVQAVSDVTFSCRAGERLAIIGPNGAGKSTLFALLGGFIRPDRGTITFDGQRIDGLTANQICRLGLSRTFQTAQPFKELTVYQNILASTYLRARTDAEAKAAATKAMELFQLTPFAAERSADLNIADQKRLELARAYATRPRLILLDEVGAGLTEIELEQLTATLMRLNVEHGVALIFIEHVMSMVSALAERVIVLQDGKVLTEGSAAEVSRNETVIRAYLGEEMLIAQD